MRTASLEFPGFGKAGVQFLTFALCCSSPCILLPGLFLYRVREVRGQGERNERSNRKARSPRLPSGARSRRWAGRSGPGDQRCRQRPWTPPASSTRTSHRCRFSHRPVIVGKWEQLSDQAGTVGWGSENLIPSPAFTPGYGGTIGQSLHLSECQLPLSVGLV